MFKKIINFFTIQDWSGSSDDDTTYQEPTIEEQPKSESSLVLPEKSDSFKLFNSENAEEWLRENVQNVSEKTQKEYILIREIIWMFIAPTNCNFFRIENNTALLQANCNLSSTSKKIFHYFMMKITRHMSYMHCLEKFCKEVFNGPQNDQNNCYESYALAIQQCLEPFKIALLAKESETILQNKIISVMNFLNEMEFHFSILECLYEIHKSCILERNDSSPHICSMFMLSSLLNKVCISSNLVMSNLALAIYLSSFKGFFSIIESWWTTGGLNEILLTDTINSISDIIEEDVVTKIILKHSLQAGNTFNILSSLDRVNAIYVDSPAIDNLHNQFLLKIFQEFEKFKSSNENEEWVFVERVVDVSNENQQKKIVEQKNFSFNEMMFTSFDDEEDDEPDDQNVMEINAFSFFVK